MSDPWRLLPEGRDVDVLLVPLADPVGSLEVGEHQDVEEFGAGSGAEGVEALPEAALQLIRPHGRRLRRRTVVRVSDTGGCPKHVVA